jgi:hypothetical protein
MKPTLIALLALFLSLPLVAADKDKPLPKDFKSLKALAEKGDAKAQYNLGLLEKDGREAAKWFRMAAEQGDAWAQYRVGRWYESGMGFVPGTFERFKDEKEAVKWYRQAALQGHLLGQRALAHKYRRGEGVEKDHIKAYKWYLLAAAQTSGVSRERWSPKFVESHKWVDILEATLSKEQITQGQKLATEWRPKTQSTDGKKSGIHASTGTGFFITEDGYLMTNLHVIDKATKILVKTKDGELPAKLVKIDARNDLAVLKVEGKFNPLPVASSRGVSLGAEVFTVGYPHVSVQGLSPKLTKGAINSLAGVKDDPRHFQVSVPIQPGNSGGPLVDERGNVVGVVVAALDAALLFERTGSLPQNVNYAVKGSFANSFLESIPKIARKLKAPNPSNRTRKFTDIVKEVEAATVLVVALRDKAASTAAAKPNAKKIAIKTQKKTVYLSSDEWKPMINPVKWAVNYQGSKRTPNQKYDTVLTFFLLPMTKDRKLGKNITENEYLEIWAADQSVIPNAVTVQLRVDKGDYWVMTRDTFLIKRTRVDKVETDPLIYKLVHFELQAVIDSRRFFIRNDL